MKKKKLLSFMNTLDLEMLMIIKKDNKENAELWKTNGVMMEDKEE